jgi:hypothetical protein
LYRTSGPPAVPRPARIRSQPFPPPTGRRKMRASPGRLGRGGFRERRDGPPHVSFHDEPRRPLRRLFAPGRPGRDCPRRTDRPIGLLGLAVDAAGAQRPLGRPDPRETQPRRQRTGRGAVEARPGRPGRGQRNVRPTRRRSDCEVDAAPGDDPASADARDSHRAAFTRFRTGRPGVGAAESVVAPNGPGTLSEQIEQLRQRDRRFRSIRFEVRGGQVTLRGTVARWQDAWEFADLVGRLTGVTGVVQGVAKE